jgi:peptidoglycan/LPS O-acetylase OafA/YrhL
MWSIAIEWQIYFIFILAVLTPTGPLLFSSDASGILTTLTVVTLACEARDGARTLRPLALHVLESPAIVQLGVFSYSLYLVHFPIVAFCDRVLLPRVSSAHFPIAMFAVAVTLSLVVAYPFHLAFERPFLSR